MQPFVTNHWYYIIALDVCSDYIHLEYYDWYDTQWCSQETQCVINKEEFKFDTQFGAIDCVKEYSFLPSVSLFDEVLKVERRLFLDFNWSPLDGVA